MKVRAKVIVVRDIKIKSTKARCSEYTSSHISPTKIAFEFQPYNKKKNQTIESHIRTIISQLKTNGLEVFSPLAVLRCKTLLLCASPATC